MFDVIRLATEQFLTVQASIYHRTTAARLFETIKDILRCLSLSQSHLKGRNARSWRIRNRGVNFRELIPEAYHKQFFRCQGLNMQYLGQGSETT